MKTDGFRSIALELPGAVESAHMNHPDFRIGGRAFASLGYPDEAWAMVALTPAEQDSFVRRSPRTFQPCKGVWGQRGATNLHLASATKAQARAALESAFRNTRSKLQGPAKARQKLMRNKGRRESMRGISRKALSPECAPRRR